VAYNRALVEDPAKAQAVAEAVRSVDKQVAHAEEMIEALKIKAPFEGQWVAPGLDQKMGAYVRRGDPVGLVASLDNVIIRATAGQSVAARLIAEPVQSVDVRVNGRPDQQLSGSILKIIEAGQEKLPSAALGYAAGGSMPTARDARNPTQSDERFFEVRIAPDKSSPVRLLSGQRVVVRFELPSRPLAVQWWQSLLQLVQRRFHV
jgi:putative peptide zinc metalloprotease protein